MKHLLVAAALLVSSLVNAAEPSINDRVLKSFNKHFTSAEDVSWTLVNKTAVANFEENDIKTTASFNDKGKLVVVMRYYKAEHLPSLIKDALNIELGNKTIHGVTEVSNSNGIIYKISLKDSKNYYDVLADADGNLEVKNIYERADK
ncbi:MAG: hypothetical protein E6Q95_01350 [Chitinophagaceae bacterium]|nr:MAG: hypothetical protein E6Q95_01350 [Chitinophagaceae bacterium]